jgi:hypothetical protein
MREKLSLPRFRAFVGNDDRQKEWAQVCSRRLRAQARAINQAHAKAPTRKWLLELWGDPNAKGRVPDDQDEDAEEGGEENEGEEAPLEGDQEEEIDGDEWLDELEDDPKVCNKPSPGSGFIGCCVELRGELNVRVYSET